MAEVKIYHNPRCSKSRQTLALLQEQGIDPEIIEYLKTPPDEKTLDTLLKKLGMEPDDLIRKNEAVYKELGLAQANRAQLLSAMVTNPVLIQRPIVVKGRQARLGRPPEDVLEIV